MSVLTEGEIEYQRGQILGRAIDSDAHGPNARTVG
jgi:hypothetical protein